MLTGVNRSLDAASAAVPPPERLHRRRGRRWRFTPAYEVSGSFDLSRVAGDPAAIALTQRNPVHLYQRPDGPLEFDSTRTSLAGGNGELRFAKVGGRRLHFETAYQHRTPGLRDQRRRLPAPGRLPGLDHLGRAAVLHSPTRCSSSCGGTSTTGSTGPPRGCPPSGPSIPTCTSSSPTAGGCTRAGRWASWGPPTATAAPAAARRCGRTPTSRPGSRSRGTTAGRWCPSLSANYNLADQGRSETIEVTPAARPQGLDPLHHLAQHDLQPEPERPPVLRHLRRPGRRAALHLRPPGAADAELHLAAGLHLHAQHVAPGVRLPLRLQGHLQRRAGDRRAPGGGVRRPLPALRRPRRSPPIRAGSTSSSSGPTWCSGGSTVRARRCSWSGARGGRTARRWRATDRSATTSATCSAGGRTTASW